MRKSYALIIILGLSGLVAQAAEARPVSGVVAVSTGPMQAFSQAIGRDLSAGDDVFLNDEVETGVKTRAQVLLRDESVFSLAPSSKVVFDEFVYDPLAEEGVLEASLVKGGMRFVSGQLAKNQPQNIKIKAGSATVGIRGTEIMATHGDKGSTFVLLSGAMEIATAAGNQLINRSGFGIDVSPDGMLGAVRQIPLAEINAILAAPPEAEDSESENESDSDSDSGENNEGESEASETEEASAEESDSSFDSAVASAADEGGEGGEDISSAEAVNVMTAASTDSTAETETVSPALSSSEAVSVIVDSLAQDAQVLAAEVADPNNIELSLSQNNIASNPYFSSDGKVLVRADSYFVISSPQFGITRDLLREKFPDAATGGMNISDGFDHVEDVTDASVNLDDYDAVMLYLGSNNALSSAEQTSLQNFIASGKSVVTIGRQATSTTTVNSALNIYETADITYDAADVAASDLTFGGSVYDAEHKAVMRPVTDSDASLLAGVSEFPGYYEAGSNFPYLDISGTTSGGAAIDTGLLEIYGDIIDTNSDPVTTLTGGPFASSGSVYQAFDFGSKGAAFFGRFSCGANDTEAGALGASVDFNFVSNGRLQFCRNLFSSLAPTASLVDVEVGSLTAVNAAGGASFTLTNHTDMFKIIDDKLLLKAGVSPSATSYNLSIDTVLADGTTGVSEVQVSVTANAPETRIVATRDTVAISNGNSGSNNSSIIINGDNLQTDLSDISWITVGSASTPSETGVLTLHYRETAGGETYDRFHEIEVNYDCEGSYCAEFATSMDTLTELSDLTHFNYNDFGLWSSPSDRSGFFDRFTTGTGSFRKSYNLSSTASYSTPQDNSVFLDVLNADYSHTLTINYGLQQGSLNTVGTFDGIQDVNGNPADFDVLWNIDFLSTTGVCATKICTLEVANAVATSTRHNMTTTSTEAWGAPSVSIANLALPNGKSGLAIKSQLGADIGACDDPGECRVHETNYEMMTPQ